MKWLLCKLGYMPRKEARSMFNRYKNMLDAELQEVIDKHGMQAAWSQVKLEHKQRKYH